MPLVSLIFLKRSLIFPILLFFSISLYWSLRKTLFPLLAILWNSAFRWIYLSFSPLPFASLLFSAIYKASSDNHFAFLHFFFLGMVLITASCRLLKTSVHSCSGTLSVIIHGISLSLPLYNCKGFDLGHTWSSGFPYFSLSLNFAVKSSWSEPQIALGHVFIDCIDFLPLLLQRIYSIWFQDWPSGDVHV